MKLEATFRIAGPKGTEQHLPHEDMPEFYRGLDLLLVTSNFEAHPLVVYEALACGCPVVMERFIGDCYAGKVKGIVYYEGFDVDAICGAVKQAYADRERLGYLGAKCIKEEWAWEIIAPSYDNFFRALEEEPKVCFAINEHGWCWDFMAREIKERIETPMDIFYLYDYKNTMQYDFAPYNIIINHIWLHLNDRWNPYYPMEANVMSVNGPAYLNALNWFTLYAKKSRAVTTVSKVLVPDLHRFGKPVYYLTRGMNMELFNPGGI